MATDDTTVEFYVLLTVHLSSVLVNNQLDPQLFFSYIFIPILYMFQALLCSSSGDSIILIPRLVYVCYVGDRQVCTLDGHLHSCHIAEVALIQLILLMMSTGMLETCRELE